MRKILLIALMFFYTANATLAFASAQHCAEDMRQGSSSTPQQPDLGHELLCHEQDDHKKSEDHCDGPCLCAHVAGTFASHLKSTTELFLFASIGQTFSRYDGVASASMNWIPPNRPP